MFENDSLDKFKVEGILRINTTGFIIELTPEAQYLLSIADVDNINVLEEYSFLDYNSLRPVLSEIPLSNDSKYIIQVNTNKNTKYLSAHFQLCQSEDEYIVSLYDNTFLIEQLIQLRKQEHHYRLLVSSINDIIFEVNKEGVFLNYWTNKPELLILPPSTFLGKVLTDVLPPAISTKASPLIRDSLENRTENTLEYSFAQGSENIKWYSLTIKPIPDNAEIVAVVITDITKQKEYQDQLIFSERKFYQAFHFSGVGTTLTSIDGYVVESNHTVSEILGYSKEELQKIRSKDITHPDDKKYDLLVRNELIEGKRNYQTFLKRYLHKSGYYVWCSITISLVRDTQKNPKYFIVQLVDMTGLKRNADELEIKRNHLETIKAHLESKILQIEEANHIIAHNFLSPLANIKMLIDSIKESREKESIDVFLELLKSSCDELDETVEDLIVITSDINRTKDKNEIELCNFHAVLEKIINIHNPTILQKAATITKDIEVKEVKTQRVTLYSIIDQLLDNALQFSDPKRKPLIHVRTYHDGNYVTLSIQDNGLGMELEKMKSQLFMFKKIFHRGFETKGIGLNITKYQVESLGGKIDLISKVGEGTTFFVKFPII